MSCLHFSENVRDGDFLIFSFWTKQKKQRNEICSYLTKHVFQEDEKKPISMLNFSKKLEFESKTLTSYQVYWTVNKLLEGQLRDLYWKKRTDIQAISENKHRLKNHRIQHNLLFFSSSALISNRFPIVRVQLFTNYTN